MISIELDKNELIRTFNEKITETLKQADMDLVYWDTNELKRRTCMSWNFIQDQFFFDPEFPKRKIGTKWYFPARETREFLERWLQKQ